MTAGKIALVTGAGTGIGRRAAAAMDVQRVADAVPHMASLPFGASVPFMTVTATKMPYAGHG